MGFPTQENVSCIIQVLFYMLFIYGFTGTEQRGVQIYNQEHPRQKAITESIIQDLIISCNVPLSLIDKQSFQEFLVSGRREILPSRSMHHSQMSEWSSSRERIQDKSQTRKDTRFVCDCGYLDWQDQCVAFRGNSPLSGNREKQSKTADSSQRSELFTGSHTGERIHLRTYVTTLI